MLLFQLLACFVLIFLAGFHWCAYRSDNSERKNNKSSLNWTVALSALGLYHLIALIGVI